ncbi:MAG: toll/interleukin-1 receptor domain-containing protein [Akkermansiaceae bacterium]|nr:toll/interleukin-1 receptor domain-containing protein [Akkermansiaceae bacterium]
MAEIARLLRGLGFIVFNDDGSMDAGDSISEACESAIRACDLLILVHSKHSVESAWVTRELKLAIELEKKIIPICLDQTPKRPELDNILAVKFGGDLLAGLSAVQQALPRLIAPSRILRHAPKELFGRDEWLDALDDVWDSRTSVNVYSLIAWGGSGKTSLVAHWVNRRLARRGWPGVERYFDWSFYSQGTREQSQASADFFIAAALEFFGDPDPTQGSAWDRGQRLAKLVRRHRTLLVLDGIEPLQYPPNSPQAGEFKDQAIEALLNALAQDNPGLCVVTSREPLKNLETFEGGGAEKKQLNHLTKEAAIALLRHLSIAGTEAEMEEAWRDAGGHALTLQLLGRFLADAHGGDIRRRKEVKFEVADRETPGRTAMKVMLAYETWLESAGPDRQRDLAVLRLMGLFDRPASGECLSVLRKWEKPGWLRRLVSAKQRQIWRTFGPLTEMRDSEWNSAIRDLETLDLITVNREGDPDHPKSGAAILSLDAHPLVREYFAKQLRDTQPEAFRAAHSRLFEHLCQSAPHQPDGIEDLQPLYQAVSHGCLAGRQREALIEVYVDRILRGAEVYSIKKLGSIGADLGAVAAFFDEPWRRLSPNEAAQAWLLNGCLPPARALGRLTEAVS